MTRSLPLLYPVSYVSSTPEALLEQSLWSLDVSVSSLSKKFTNGNSVLKDISLQVHKNESVSLIGANGTGKSTLLRCLVRLVEPTGGRIALLGKDITSISLFQLRKIRSQIGFVWQRHNLVPRMSVMSNVIHGAQGRSGDPRLWSQTFSPRHIREEALHCLELVGLAHLAARRCDMLSGGESQRVAMARTLMQRPRLILADEPVASLDPKVGEELMQLLVNLVQQQGITLLFTSHDLDHALRFSKRVIALQNGQVAIDDQAARLDLSMLRSVYHEN